MAESNDNDLMGQYADGKSEAAFAELVRRHINLVYSVALRFTRNDADAQDVTQTVFVILAQKVAGLRQRISLTGWLYETTRLVARQHLRTQARQQSRDQEAYMQSSLNEHDLDGVWQQLSPLLEEGMSQLSECERHMLALRFFENKSIAETASLLGIKEWAAHKRVSRAIDKLRTYFAKRGLTLSAAGLTLAIATHSVQAAPLELAAAVTAAAVAETTITTSAVIAATKTTVMTALQKTLVTATVAVLAGVGIFEARQATQLREQYQTLRQSQTSLTQEIQQLRRQRDDATNQLAGMLVENARLKSNPNEIELLRLRGETARLRSAAQELALSQAALQALTNDPTETAIRAWVAQAANLRQKIDQMPDIKIPEYEFLTASDWLDVAKNARVETQEDLTNAAQMLGADAKNRFAALAEEALNKYLDANGGELPSSMSELKPFFAISVDDGVLQRYEMLHSGNISILSDSDRNFRLITEIPTAAPGSGRPLVQIGTSGFIRTGQ